MPFMIVVLTLFAGLIVTEAEAATDAELKALAEKFSPILILAQENGGDYENSSVIKPELVEIMGAESSGNIWFELSTLDGRPVASARLSSLIESEVLDINDIKKNQVSWFPAPKKVDLLGNKFAFFFRQFR